MSNKLYFLISFVLVLVLAGNVLAYDQVSWDNNSLGGDQMWDTNSNWDILGPPKWDFKVPDANDWVAIDKWADPCNNNYPIIDADTNAVVNWIGLGELGGGTAPVLLKMTGGTLTAGNWFELGGYFDGTFRIDMSGGTITAPYIWVGYQQGSYCTINMSGGTINTETALSIGTYSTSYATFNITGGDVNLGGWLEIGAYRPVRRGVGHVDMHGGTIETISLSMGGGGVGSMDFAYDGTLIIDGDYRMPNGWLFDPLVDDAANEGEHTGTIAILTDRGIITAYDVNVGEIIGSQYPSVEGKRALINLDYNNVNPGQTTITAGADDSNLAWDPDPLFGSADLYALDINLLSWAAGDNAVKHDVYFGTTFAEVNEANTASDPNIYLGRQLLADVNKPPGFVTWHKTYYWRIDEINDSNVPQWGKGRVWNFATRPAWARNPIPTGDAAALFPVLTWDAGPVVAATAGHYVYFSTDFNDVNDRDPNFLIIRDTNNYSPPEMLEFSTQYWWAVDEFNAVETPNTWPSLIWDFTTEAYVFVDNMESYANNDDIKAVWNDYWFDDTLRSDIYVETGADWVRNGDTSMRYSYDNVSHPGDKTGYSEAWANVSDLWARRNWTVSGAKALVLYFRGRATNPELQPMYVVLSDDTNEGMVTYDDGSSIQEEFWHPWYIDLNDSNFTTGATPGPVDMSNVSKIYLGIGIRGHMNPGAETGGTGNVYFDDIGLYPPMCFPEQVETDISGGCIRGDCLSYGTAGDCITDMCDVEVMAGDWLEYDYNVPAEAITAGPNLIGWWKFDEGVGTTTVDSSGYGNHGTIFSGTDWSVGYPNDPCDKGLYFGADSIAHFDHVKCAVRINEGNQVGDYPAALMPSTFTVACWLKVHSGSDNEYYFDTPVCGGTDEGEGGYDACGWYLWSRYDYDWYGERSLGELGLGIKTAKYGYTQYVYGPIQYPADTWYHLAATYDDANTACVYVDGKLTQKEDIGGPMVYLDADGKYPEYFVIGGLPVKYSSNWYYFEGNIDDVRLYDYALSYGQIVTLAEQGPAMYHDIVSPANLSDDEAKFSKKIDFKDYRILADHWLEGPILWPN